MFDPSHYAYPGASEIPLPKVAAVRQRFERHGLVDVAREVNEQLSREDVRAVLEPGSRVAVGVGSRGVANTARVVKTLVAKLKEEGLDPFVFPAMGSHGGATEAGQKAVLESYGVHEKAIGAPVRATMEVQQVARMADGTPLYVDRFACEADGIILVNRVKPHTAFRGPIESGIVKMMIIGMGKIAGATVMHSDKGMDRFGDVLPEAARCLLPHIKFLFGLALVEDAYDQTACVEALLPDVLLEREAALLEMARAYMPRLYIDPIDVLVVDRLGKEISGSGMDPNIVGRNHRGIEGFGRPVVQKIVVFDLSEQTHGNATGIGNADVITRKLFDKIDATATYTNVITSTYLDGAAIPLIMPGEKAALQVAIGSVPRVRPEDIRLVRIRDTLSLAEIQVSESLLPEVKEHPHMEVESAPAPMMLDLA